MALHFDATDDKYFADLVANGTIAGQNPLVGLKPSSLNLTSNCWATGDILHILVDTTDKDEFSRLQALSNDLRTSLPDELAGASSHSIYDYLMTLHQPKSFQPVFVNTFQNCNQTGFLHAPESEVDFMRDCSVTGRFWQRNVYGENWTDMGLRVSLFRSSLPPPFTTMSNHTLELLGLDAVKDKCFRGKECFRPPFQSMLSSAAKNCASDACKKLNFNGSADIAGPGVSPAVKLCEVSADFPSGYCGVWLCSNYDNVPCHDSSILSLPTRATSIKISKNCCRNFDHIYRCHLLAYLDGDDRWLHVHSR